MRTVPARGPPVVFDNRRRTHIHTHTHTHTHTTQIDEPESLAEHILAQTTKGGFFDIKIFFFFGLGCVQFVPAVPMVF